MAGEALEKNNNYHTYTRYLFFVVVVGCIFQKKTCVYDRQDMFSWFVEGWF